MSDAVGRWSALSSPWQTAFEEAWTSWRSGSSGVGAAVADGEGSIVATGRNRIHDRPDGLSPLAGTPMAHAEMNALASLPPGMYAQHTLVTTFEPCFMCIATISGTYRIGRVLFAAPDPTWRGLQLALSQHPNVFVHLPQRELLGGPFGALAHVLHLAWIIKQDPKPDAHLRLAPAVLRAAEDLVERKVLERFADDDMTVAKVAEELWAMLLILASPSG